MKQAAQIVRRRSKEVEVTGGGATGRESFLHGWSRESIIDIGSGE